MRWYNTWFVSDVRLWLWSGFLPPGLGDGAVGVSADEDEYDLCSRELSRRNFRAW